MKNTFAFEIGRLIQIHINAQVEKKISIQIANIKSYLLTSTYLTSLELKDYLRFKNITSVDNMVKGGIIKYKVGKKTLFLRSEVDAFVRKNW